METAGKHVDRESQAFEKLKGLKKHFCPDWDYMAIDETCDEFQACTCSWNYIATQQQAMSKGKLTGDELKAVFEG